MESGDPIAETAILAEGVNLGEPNLFFHLLGILNALIMVHDLGRTRVKKREDGFLC